MRGPWRKLVSAAQRWSAPSSGANLGANSSGRLWTGMDGCGLGGLLFLAVWTAVDGCGHGLEIYGSGGWGFEFLRACQRNPCESGGFVALPHGGSLLESAVGAILVSHSPLDRRSGRPTDWFDQDGMSAFRWRRKRHC